MSRHYTPAEKANALIHLHMNGGDIPYTSRQLGISERTLFYWRRNWYAENLQQQSPSLQIERPDFKDDLDALAYLRKQIMAELLNMADSFRDGTIFATPAQRIHLLSQLLDRLMKLDAHLKPYGPPQTVSFRFTWDCGLYLRTPEGYIGPFTPVDLPANWKEIYGPSTRLEIYWGNDTFTILPDDSPITAYLLDVQNFQDDPCQLAPDTAEKKQGSWIP